MQLPEVLPHFVASSDVSMFLLQNNSSGILLFGGEYYDGKSDKMRVYNALYVYHTEKGTWSRIKSPSGRASTRHAALLQFDAASTSSSNFADLDSMSGAQAHAGLRPGAPTRPYFTNNTCTSSVGS